MTHGRGAFVAFLRMWVAVLGLGAVLAVGAPSEPGGAAALRERHQRLAPALAASPFGRPVLLESSETPDGLQGDVHAVIDHPLVDLVAALRASGQWCEMLSLHINNRRCTVSRAGGGRETLTLSVVQRYDKPVEEAFELPFAYRVSSATPEYLAVDMSAADGPLGTRNYTVSLEAVALDERRSFLHFSYGYEHNMLVRMATQAYLATFGARKVGFTVVGQSADGQPEYIRGLRGLVERNAMRYFLTLDAHLDGLHVPPAQQAEHRQRAWFAAVERYPRQLHEIDQETYLAAKRADRARAARDAREPVGPRPTAR